MRIAPLSLILSSLGLVALIASSGACGSETCRVDDDCTGGFYCVKTTCTQECASAQDCADKRKGNACSARGRCTVNTSTRS